MYTPWLGDSGVRVFSRLAEYIYTRGLTYYLCISLSVSAPGAYRFKCRIDKSNARSVR